MSTLGGDSRAQGASPVNRLDWTWARLDQLAPRDVFDTLRLRQSVFVLEQTCLYPDIDDLDLAAWHLLGRDVEGKLMASLRVVDPGARYGEPSIGRVVVSPHGRGHGFGRTLMAQGMSRTARHHRGAAVRISAQTYLEDFYASYGFRRVGESYLEDGIPHIEMLCVDLTTHET